MTPAQCRAARALVNMTLKRLASLAVLPAALLWDYEAEHGHLGSDDIKVIRDALEFANVEFIDGDRPGVRLRQPVGR
jgi:hypothetical protein